ncbi:hypothetical protein EVA_11763 [gut metagenome]|uniref:Uncharacterized protein n=1 Tax=gut metagenome TaxID=749906 RepID=J9FYU2_9ZZZZ
MVVIFHSENVYQLSVGRELLKLFEDTPAVTRQLSFNFLCTHLGHVCIAAVCKELCGLLETTGVQHTLGSVVIEKFRLPCP